MAHEELILDKLTEIANKLDEQNLLQKTTLNFNEACKYRAKNSTSNGRSWIPGYNVTANQQQMKLIRWLPIMLSATNARSSFFLTE